MLWFALACTPPQDPPTIVVPEVVQPLPEGAFAVAFDFGFPVNGSTWTLIPAGEVERAPDLLSLVVQETWTEPSIVFPDCPIDIHLAGTVSADDPHLYEVVSTEVYDPCAIQAYEADTPYVVRFVERELALTWLVETLSISTSALEAGEAGLTTTYGPSSDWFAFWGPAEDQLWPLGHVFPEGMNAP